MTKPTRLIEMLGADIEAPCVIAFVEEQSKNGKWEFDDDVSFFSLPSEGIELRFNEKSRLSSIFIRPSEVEPGALLPEHLSFEFSRREVRERLGNPTSTGGGGNFLNKPVPEWDKYAFHTHIFHIQYSQRLTSIDQVTLQALPEPGGKS
jgi:hypothetical protein